MHFGEMKLYIRKKKITKKIKQATNTPIILGVGLMFWIIFLPILNIFFSIPKLYEFFLVLNFCFLLMSYNFLKCILLNKGFMTTMISIPNLFISIFNDDLCSFCYF